MKRLILFELMIIFLATTFESDSPPGWFQQVLPVNDQINDIFFLDSLTGWVVTNSNLSSSDSGYIMKTIDGGSNWNIQHKGVVSFNVVQFLDNNTGYAGAVDPLMKFYKTTNSGNNWLVVSSLLTGLTDMFFADSNTGWYCDPSGFGGLYRTTNGGVNWEQQLNDTYQPIKLFFINKDTGWAGSADNKIYRTNNSGLNWNLQMNFFSEDIVDIFFSSKDTGWIHGGATGIYRTTNGGSNWDTQSTPLGYGNGKLYFVDSHHGWVGRSNGRMLVTNDGLTWGMQITPAGSHFSVQMLDTLKGWAGTSNLIHTTDGGGPFVGIQQISNEIPSEYKLSQNYPNPFNPVTNIKYSIMPNKKGQMSKVLLSIFDVTGKEVTKLVNEEQNAGTYLADWNASGFATGLYFYSLIVDGVVIETRKMLLIK